jgi:branched-chain amino acid transport system permease protein
VLGAYAVTVLTLMGIWSIVALGLNVITGYAGQFNLGIGVYMGTGAYTAAMLTTGAGLDVWLALLCALAASAMMGFLTGLPALRVREDSLAVFTIGLVFVFESLLIYLPYFGGPVGIGRIPSVAINGIPLGKEGYLALVLAALAIIIAATLYLKRAWIGLAWASIRENELATNVIGIHPARFKLYAFTVGATFAGLGGVLYAHFIHYVTPYDFGFLPSIYVLVMIVFHSRGGVWRMLLDFVARVVSLRAGLPKSHIRRDAHRVNTLRTARSARRWQLCMAAHPGSMAVRSHGVCGREPRDL